MVHPDKFMLAKDAYTQVSRNKRDAELDKAEAIRLKNFDLFCEISDRIGYSIKELSNVSCISLDGYEDGNIEEVLEALRLYGYGTKYKMMGEYDKRLFITFTLNDVVKELK